MSNITEEEKQELVIGFIRHVYEEVQTEGWKTRRNEYLQVAGFHFEDDFFRDDMTFQKKMERKNYNLDEVISSFLCRVINNINSVWFLAWISELRPDLNIKEAREQWNDQWDRWAWKTLNEFLYIEKSWHTEIVNYELVKDVLGLNIDLK